MRALVLLLLCLAHETLAQGAPAWNCGVRQSCTVSALVAESVAAGSLTATGAPLGGSGLSGATSVRLGSYSATEAGVWLGKTAPSTTNFSVLGDASGNTYVNATATLFLARSASARVQMNSTGFQPQTNGGMDLGSSSAAWGVAYALSAQIGASTAKPTCAVGLRGRLYTTFGGAGVADVTHQCLKDTADTYSWVQVVTAP